MGRSLSLAAYRVLARRQAYSGSRDQSPRPTGEVLWAHATNEQRYSALCDLSLRLRSLRADLHLLVTIDKNHFNPPPPHLDGCDQIVSLSSDHPETVKEFLDHWQPDLCLWAGGNLMPNLISAASDRKIPMLLLDVGESDFPSRRYQWFRDLTRPSLGCFDMILVNSDAAAQMIQRIGAPEMKVRVTARLRNGATPPPCSDDELTEVTKDIASRPVWLAAHVTDSEFEAVLSAHRSALRLVHRLLLVLITDKTADADALKRRLSQTSLRSIDWDTGDVIDDNTQVIVSRDEDNLGLWYRIAPLTFMANSLGVESTGYSPLEAAALGSAVLYGPGISNHADTYARLAEAGAARDIRDGASLGEAVIQLVAPDRAATMALAGWEVVTEGAHLMDELIDLIIDFLDLRGVPDATT